MRLAGSALGAETIAIGAIAAAIVSKVCVSMVNNETIEFV